MPQNGPPRSPTESLIRAEVRRLPTIAEDTYNELLHIHDLIGAVLRPDVVQEFAAQLRALGVASDLTQSDQEMLAHQVMVFTSHGNRVVMLASERRRRAEWARRGEGRLKTLRGKLTKAQTAVRSVSAYVETLEIPLSREVEAALELALHILDPRLMYIAEGILEALRRPEDDALLALYDFFMKRLRDRVQAEIRVGKIGNKFWGWGFLVIEKPKRLSDERRGCEQVRSAVRGRRKRQLQKGP